MNFLHYVSLGIKYRKDPVYIRYISGRRVLDVGCGRGEFLARDPENAIGVDLDEALVNQCTSRGLTAFRMSALALEFPDDSFDAVHAAQLIEHFSPGDAVKFLEEIARVLRPGGFALLTTPGVRNVWNTFSHIRPYPPTAFQKLLGSATENYLRVGQPQLEMVYAQGNRFFFGNRALTFLSSLFDLLLPPSDPIGWTIVLRKTANPANPR